MPFLNEEQCRLYVASEVQALGRGVKTLINRELGISRTTINSGIADLKTSDPAQVRNPLSRQRKKGGGRKRTINDQVWKKIETFVMPHSRGEPTSPLQWVSKSLRNIKEALQSAGISVSHRIIGDALKARGFSLQTGSVLKAGAIRTETHNLNLYRKKWIIIYLKISL